MSNKYGSPPIFVGLFRGEEFTELMHWLYLPIHLPKQWGLTPKLKIQMPKQLAAQGLLEGVFAALDEYGPEWEDRYVYITARRGYATPDNPLNRTGWHTDGFGTDDVNYIWSDRYPTRWLDMPSVHPYISEDHAESLVQFEQLSTDLAHRVQSVKPHGIYRLSPYVIHTTPIIPESGGMRSWVKVSISKHKYNLIGNSHNYELDYDWEMVERDTVRNDPAKGQMDFA